MLVTIDFETYWDTGYSLSKMNAVEYVQDPRFEVISCSIAVDDAEPAFYFGADNVAVALANVDWANAMVLGHNMVGFDALILAHRCGVKPKLWLDTAAMAMEKHAKTCGVSLKALAEHYHLGVKNQAALLNTKGKRAKDFTETERWAMQTYNNHDVTLTRALFHKLKGGFTREELWLIDATARMVTEPMFVADVPMLESAYAAEQARKSEALTLLAAELHVQDAEDMRKVLASSAQLAYFLRSRGVDPPMKASPATGLDTYAFAKTDQEFVALQEHPDALVAQAVQTRLDVQSSLLEKRLVTMITVARLCDGRIPAPLRYCGADTTGRWSGEAWNMQNLPRVNPDKPALSDALRKALCAPPGHKVVVADLSGIELRVNHFLWKVPGSMAAFKADVAGADLYRAFAAKLYNKPVEEVSKLERQVGKVAQLGLGYGAGWMTFQGIARTMGNVALSEQDARNVVDTWRMVYPEIVRGWRACNDALPQIRAGAAYRIDSYGHVLVEREALALPSGRRIRYPQLTYRAGDNGGEWTYGGKRPVKLYGAKVVENIVQALARDILAHQVLTLWQETGYRPSLLVHDEIVLVVPEGEADAALAKTLEIMRRPIPWWEELPLWAEGGIGDNYGEAKG